jgi:hypothetical protein
MSSTFLPLAARFLNADSSPRIGPARRDDATAALYPGRWADWIRTSWVNYDKATSPRGTYNDIPLVLDRAVKLQDG